MCYLSFSLSFSMVLINLKYMLWWKKFFFFQLVVFKINGIVTVYCFNYLPWTFTGSNHREVFCEMNLNHETLKFWYLLNALKEQCRSNVKKHVLLWSKHECQHSADIFVKNIFNSFCSTGLFLYLLKYIRKIYWGFLIFSGGIQRAQYHEMFWKSFNIHLLILLHIQVTENNWKLINFHYLIHMVNLSHIMRIKLCFFFLDPRQ